MNNRVDFVSEQTREQIQKAVEQVFSNISHEIRTPMNGVLGMIDLLQNTRLNEEQKEFVEVLQNSATALMAVITDILDFSRIESGGIECSTIDFNLRTTIEAVKKSMSAKVAKKGLNFVVSVHTLVPSLLKGDPEKLRQILTHLLENAVKFTEKGQIVLGIVSVKESSTHATIRFEVGDTGIGIEPAKLHTIFESFSQADGSTTRKYGGTGIGLTISRQLVYLMEGKIDVQSTPGKGSIFNVTMEFEKQLIRSTIPISIPKSIKGKKILIVDNDAANRLMIKELLKSWGCVFDEAAEADRALGKLISSGRTRQKFDVVLIDMQMPGKDGETFAKQIRSNPDFTELILIMLSSMGKRGDVARLKKIGVQGYLPKPVKSSLLFDCIATALSTMGMSQGQETRQIITRHFLKENKKQQVRILLIDSDRVNRKMVNNILNKSGYAVEIAQNMTEAADAFETGRFNIILTQSFETIKLIRELEKKNGFKKTTLIAMADHPAKRDDKTDADDIISKPVTLDNLLKVIEKWTAKTDDDFDGKMIKRPKENIFNFDAALERAMDDKSFLEMLLNEFIKSLPAKLDGIKESIMKKEYKALTLQAHSLRGSASTIGADGISRVALELEKIADVGDFESMQGKIKVLADEFLRFKEHINTINWSDA